MLQLNEKVQDFTLPAVGGQSISLSDYEGKKLVIYFYPKDMTPGCTQQACDFRDSESYLTTKNAAVIGHISAQQGYVPVIELVNGKIYLGCGARSAAFHRFAVRVASALFTSIGICFSRHISTI